VENKNKRSQRENMVENVTLPFENVYPGQNDIQQIEIPSPLIAQISKTNNREINIPTTLSHLGMGRYLHTNRSWSIENTSAEQNSPQNLRISKDIQNNNEEFLLKVPQKSNNMAKAVNNSYNRGTVLTETFNVIDQTTSQSISENRLDGIIIDDKKNNSGNNHQQVQISNSPKASKSTMTYFS